MALMALGPRAHAAGRAEDEQAAAFVRKVGDQLVAVVNGSAPEAEKRRELQRVIDNSVDVDGVARFCLGRYWHNATAEQRQQYTLLFHDVLVHNITGHLGEYQGVQFTVGRTRTHEDAAIVSTVVERPNNPPAQVDWVLGNNGSGLKIVDVVAEGTSLRLTQRSDYASYLRRNGENVQALIEAMRQQISEQNG